MRLGGAILPDDAGEDEQLVRVSMFPSDQSKSSEAPSTMGQMSSEASMGQSQDGEQPAATQERMVTDPPGQASQSSIAKEERDRI